MSSHDDAEETWADVRDTVLGLIERHYHEALDDLGRLLLRKLALKTPSPEEDELLRQMYAESEGAAAVDLATRSLAFLLHPAVGYRIWSERMRLDSAMVTWPRELRENLPEIQPSQDEEERCMARLAGLAKALTRRGGSGTRAMPDPSAFEEEYVLTRRVLEVTREAHKNGNAKGIRDGESWLATEVARDWARGHHNSLRDALFAELGAQYVISPDGVRKWIDRGHVRFPTEEEYQAAVLRMVPPDEEDGN